MSKKSDSAQCKMHFLLEISIWLWRNSVALSPFSDSGTAPNNQQFSSRSSKTCTHRQTPAWHMAVVWRLEPSSLSHCFYVYYWWIFASPARLAQHLLYLVRKRRFMRAGLSRKCLDCECSHGENHRNLSEFFCTVCVMHVVQGSATWASWPWKAGRR